MSHSLNSSTFNRRRSALRDDIDRSAYTAGQTLASVVNDPRAPQHTFSWGFGSDANKKDVPTPIDPVKYPPVSRQDMQQYLSVVSGTFERFLRDRHSLEAHDVIEDAEASTSRDGVLSGAAGGQGEAFVQAMQQVPLQYFQEDFEENWHDFFVQFCQSQDQDAEQLYEQIDELNKYLDTVEMQLLKEVAARSNSFFRAASSLQHLRGLLCDAIDSVKALRRRVADLDSGTYKAAVTVTAMQHRRQNLVAVLDVTKALEDLLNCQQALDCLLESQDYAGALELLENMTHMLANQSLAGLQCIRHLPPQVKDTIGVVENLLAQEFVVAVSHSELPKLVERAVKQALQQPGDSEENSQDAMQQPLQQPPQAAPNGAALEQLHDKLLPLAVGLHKADKLAGAMAQYKDNAAAEVKSAVRDVVQRLLPALLAGSGSGGGLLDGAVQGAATEAQLADQLQVLQHGEFMALLRAVLCVIESCMEHALTVGAVVEDILKGAQAPASQLAAVRKDTAGALQQVVDVGQGRWVKLVAARTNAHMRLKLYELRQLLDLSEAAAARAEQKGAKPLPSYRMALQAQCKAFLDNMHSRSVMQLQHLLESEQWVVVEVPASFQQIVDRLVARCDDSLGPAPGAAGAAAGTTPDLPPGIREGPSDSPPGETSGQAPSGSPPMPAMRMLVLSVRGKHFHLVNSALMLLKLLDEYLSLHDIIPSFGAEIVHRLLELLKFFNSHTCQLVLGAGAMRTAGLKSISAKQLALSCQCVAAVATLQPLLRACSLAVVSNARRALLMPEFDRLMADLNTHMDEIHSKLVDIMADRLSAAVKQLPGDMSALTVSPDAPLPTITMLARQMMTLRAVLGPILLPEETEYIFGAVTRQASEQLTEAFEGLVARGPLWEPAVAANALHMLRAFKELPLDKVRSSSYTSRLSTFYTKHFGLPPEEAQRMNTIKQQQQAQKQAQPATQPLAQQAQQQQQQQQQQSRQQQPEQQLEHAVQQQHGPPNTGQADAVPEAALSQQDVQQLSVAVSSPAGQLEPAKFNEQKQQPSGSDMPQHANGVMQPRDEQAAQQEQQPSDEQAAQQPEQQPSDEQAAQQQEQQPSDEQAAQQQEEQPSDEQAAQQQEQQPSDEQAAQQQQQQLRDGQAADPLEQQSSHQLQQAATSQAAELSAATDLTAVAQPAPAPLQPVHSMQPSQDPLGVSSSAAPSTTQHSDLPMQEPQVAQGAAAGAAATGTEQQAPTMLAMPVASVSSPDERAAEHATVGNFHDMSALAAQEADSSSAAAPTEAATASSTDSVRVPSTAAEHGAMLLSKVSGNGTSTSSSADMQQAGWQAPSTDMPRSSSQAVESIGSDHAVQPDEPCIAGTSNAQLLGGRSASGQLASGSSSLQPLDALFAELDTQQEQLVPDSPAAAQSSAHETDAQPEEQQQQQQQQANEGESQVLTSLPTVLHDVDLLSTAEPAAAAMPEISALASMVAQHVAHTSSLTPAANAAAEDDPLDSLGQEEPSPAEATSERPVLTAIAGAASTAEAGPAPSAAEGAVAAHTTDTVEASSTAVVAANATSVVHADVPASDATADTSAVGPQSAADSGTHAGPVSVEQLRSGGPPAAAEAVRRHSTHNGLEGAAEGGSATSPMAKAAQQPADVLLMDPLGAVTVVANGVGQQPPKQQPHHDEQQPSQHADDGDLL